MTVTVNLQLAVFPKISVKSYLTIVEPTGNNIPDTCVESLLTASPELSVAVGSIHVTVTGFCMFSPLAKVLVMSFGQPDITGSMLSTVKKNN